MDERFKISDKCYYIFLYYTHDAWAHKPTPVSFCKYEFDIGKMR